MTADPAGDAAEPREIIIEADAWTRLPFGEGEAEATSKAAGDAAADALGLAAGHGWAVLLTDDNALARLNADYRGKEGATNVLSFPAYDAGDLPSGGGHLGDIAISVETIVAESLDAGKSPLHHLAHMVVHGVAHLAGLDHGTDAEAAAMEAIETCALAELGAPNPYLEGEAVSPNMDITERR